jgi:hypothetical protein
MNLSGHLFALLLLLPTAAYAQQTIDVYDDHGGIVPEYDAHWADLAAQGVSVRIVGPCQSACTVLLGHIPRERICVTPDARLGFHLAKVERSTRMLWAAYAPDIRQWINDHGGLTHDFIWMSAPETYRYFKKC